MYSISFNNYDGASFDLAAQQATAVQAEQIARTGIALAMTKVGGVNLPGNRTYSEITATVLSGQVKYSAEALSTTQSEVTSTATYNNQTIVVKAVFVYYNNRWRVNRVYVTPTA